MQREKIQLQDKSSDQNTLSFDTNSRLQQAVRSKGQPLDAMTRNFLEPRFGHRFGEINIHNDSEAESLSSHFHAHAFTHGNDIFFSAGKFQPATDSGIHLLVHELLHVMQFQKNGIFDAKQSENPNGSSEAEARSASKEILTGRNIGSISSEAATVNKWESDEHIDAVDGAAARLGQIGQENDAAAQIRTRIELANGINLTAGEVTALMGDFYGSFDQHGFNAENSFELMNRADPTEMRRLIAAMRHDASVREARARGDEHLGEPTSSNEYEEITEGRNGNPQGVSHGSTRGGLSFMQLADRNSNHFSSAQSTGNDNNIGTYQQFHTMALEAAQQGDQNRARALEASAMHYLTDRFSAGHNFNKDEAMEQSGRSGLLVDTRNNAGVLAVHDLFNEQGISMENHLGNHWNGFGDNHWHDTMNEPNRQHTSEAVYASYRELSGVLSGENSSTDVARHGYSALEVIPAFNPARQVEANHRAANPVSTGTIMSLRHRASAGDNISAASGAETAVTQAIHNTEDSIHNAANSVVEAPRTVTSELEHGIRGLTFGLGH
jgi:Domain of unknown function (DUF4157)